jgi:hypothetical protein
VFGERGGSRCARMDNLYMAVLGNGSLDKYICISVGGYQQHTGEGRAMNSNAAKVLLAILLSNTITLLIYFLGFPMLALVLSAPIGLFAGIIVGFMIHPQSRA